MQILGFLVDFLPSIYIGIPFPWFQIKKPIGHQSLIELREKLWHGKLDDSLCQGESSSLNQCFQPSQII